MAEPAPPSRGKATKEWSYTSTPYMPSWCVQGQLYIHIMCIK